MTQGSRHGFKVLFKLYMIHMIKYTCSFPLMQFSKIRKSKCKRAGIFASRLQVQHLQLRSIPNPTSITRCHCGPCLSLNKKKFIITYPPKLLITLPCQYILYQAPNTRLGPKRKILSNRSAVLSYNRTVCTKDRFSYIHPHNETRKKLRPLSSFVLVSRLALRLFLRVSMIGHI